MNREMIITSRQNPLIKTVCALSEKKKRREMGMFRFDGSKLLEEAIRHRIPLTYVLLHEQAERFLPLVHKAVEEGLLAKECVLWVGDSAFEKMSEEHSPEGVITVAGIPENLHVRAAGDSLSQMLGHEERILVAQALRDPGNLGTVLRSCAALGIDRVILSEDCAELWSPKTMRAAMGAIFRMPTVTVDNLPQAIGSLRRGGRRVYATALHREALAVGEFPLHTGDCFVIGNEGHGLTVDVIEACDASAIIPMREGSESLNAAAAAAICIWETVRA